MPRQAQKITIRDIARIAGVSVATVSRALNHSPLVKPDKQARIRSLAQKLGFQLNTSARNLRSGKSHNIVIVLHRLNGDQLTPDFGRMELLSRISLALEEYGYHAIIVTNFSDGLQLSHKFISAGKADGFIFIGQGRDDTTIRVLHENDIPVVAWGAPLEEQGYITVGPNLRSLIRSVISDMITEGRNHFAFIGDPQDIEGRERCKGIMDAVSANDNHCTVKEITCDDSCDSVIGAILDERRRSGKWYFDAMICVSDMTAVSAVSALLQANINIPQDTAVLGIGDTPIARHFYNGLTTIRINYNESAWIIVEKMMNLIRGQQEQSHIIPGEVVYRNTYQPQMGAIPLS